MNLRKLSLSGMALGLLILLSGCLPLLTMEGIKKNCQQKTQVFEDYRKAVEQCTQILGCHMEVDDLTKGQALYYKAAKACLPLQPTE